MSSFAKIWRLVNIIIEKSINNPIKKKKSINKYKNEKNQTELQRKRERERCFLVELYASIGCTCKARAVSTSKKINIDFVDEIVNFDSLNLIILKKKFKNTIKYYNIFTKSLFLGSE